MSHKQPASLSSHLFDGLLHSSYRGENERAERCARHAADAGVCRYAQSALLHNVLCTDKRSFCESEHGVEQNVSVKKGRHYVASLVGAQRWRQHERLVVGYVKLLESVAVAAQAFVAVAYVRRSGNVHDALATAAYELSTMKNDMI